jgi:HSP20 family molecular chaperone IbpA
MSNKRKRSIMDILDNYFDELEEEFERWRETLIERPSWNQKACTMEPLRDIMVTPTEVIVTVDLPYTEENMIQVKPLDKSIIQISANMKRKIRLDDFGITHHRGEFQKLHCHTRIPVPVDMDKMKMRFKKGILEIRLPRKHEYEIPIE